LVSFHVVDEGVSLSSSFCFCSPGPVSSTATCNIQVEWLSDVTTSVWQRRITIEFKLRPNRNCFQSSIETRLWNSGGCRWKVRESAYLGPCSDNNLSCHTQFSVLRSFLPSWVLMKK
jgi:hypothetical protein